MRILVSIALAAVVGCTQQTEAPVAQPTRQEQSPLTDQAAQGSNSNVNIWLMNATEGAPPRPGGAPAFPTSQPFAALGSADAGSVREGRAGYMIAGTTINVHTGGSTTGAQSSGAVSGQSSTPGTTITQSPEQKPETSAQIPVTVALPGGAASGTATGATGQGQATATASQQAELRTLIDKARNGDPAAKAALVELWKALSGGEAAPPVVPPSP